MASRELLIVGGDETVNGLILQIAVSLHYKDIQIAQNMAVALDMATDTNRVITALSVDRNIDGAQLACNIFFRRETSCSVAIHSSFISIGRLRTDEEILLMGYLANYVPAAVLIPSGNHQLFKNFLESKR